MLISFFQNCRAQAETYSEPYQRFKMTFFEKTVNSSRGVFTTKSNIFDEAFWEKIFSRPLFQSFTIYTKSSILDVRLRCEYASGAVNYFCKGSILMFEWVLDTPLMFKERQKLQKTCKWVIIKSVAAKTKKWFLRNFWENLYWEMIFFTVIFSKFCKKLRSSHQRCYIKKDLFKIFVIFTGKHLCWSLFWIKSQDWIPTTLLKRDSNAGVFLWILQNFSEHLFSKTSANDCFCKLQISDIPRESCFTF